jgi:hypothetical protein
MSATSPAPWEVTSNGGAMTIVARDRSVVAVVLGSGAASPFESSNAHLLAAAPEMFEALSVFLDCFDRGLVTLPKTGLEIARAALAKAVGQ